MWALWTAVLAALAAQAAPAVTTNGSLAVLRCVYRDAYRDQQPGGVAAPQLYSSIQCCRRELQLKRESFLAIDFQLVKYIELTGDGNEVQEQEQKCQPDHQSESITTDELRNYVCNISKEFENLSELDWPESIEQDNFLLTNDTVRRRFIAQMLQVYDRIVTAALTNLHCYILRREDFRIGENMSYDEMQKMFEEFKTVMYAFMEKHMQFLSFGTKAVQKLAVPYSYEKLRANISLEELSKWIELCQKVENWFHGKLRYYINDNFAINKDLFSGKIEEDPNVPGSYVLRWPLPRVTDITFGDLQSGRSDCWECCNNYGLSVAEPLKPIADMEYAFYRGWLGDQVYYYVTAYLAVRAFGGPRLRYKPIKTDTVWPLKDQGNTSVSVDVRCVRLMSDLIDNPGCPIEQLSEESKLQQRHCRLQLESDLKRSLAQPGVPSPSDGEKVSMDLCLLSWMITNSNSICEEVPTSFRASPEATFCFFNSTSDRPCDVNLTKELCSIAREVLWFKCNKYVDNFFFLELNLKQIMFDYKEDMNKIPL